MWMQFLQSNWRGPSGRRQGAFNFRCSKQQLGFVTCLWCAYRGTSTGVTRLLIVFQHIGIAMWDFIQESIVDKRVESGKHAHEGQAKSRKLVAMEEDAQYVVQSMWGSIAQYDGVDREEDDIKVKVKCLSCNSSGCPGKSRKWICDTVSLLLSMEGEFSQGCVDTISLTDECKISGVGRIDTVSLEKRCLMNCMHAWQHRMTVRHFQQHCRWKCRWTNLLHRMELFSVRINEDCEFVEVGMDECKVEISSWKQVKLLMCHWTSKMK